MRELVLNEKTIPSEIVSSLAGKFKKISSRSEVTLILPDQGKTSLNSSSYCQPRVWGVEFAYNLIFDGRSIGEIRGSIASIQWFTFIGFVGILPFFFIVSWLLISRSVKEISILARREEKIIQDQRVSELAKQVSHDIRSPLSALNLTIGALKAVPENQRLLLHQSIQRINDIANDLLQNNRTDQTYPAASPQLLSVLLDELVSEKRLQYSALAGVTIEFDMRSEYFAYFATVQSSEFKRIISNLINNSVEALINRSGRVVVSMSGDTEKIVVEITDNGKGIDPKILPELGQAGKSFGKAGSESGSGLGLYHARRTLASWNGELRIESELEKGTTVRILLVRGSAPQSATHS